MRLGWYELARHLMGRARANYETGVVRTGSASNGLACSGFQTKLLGSLQSYAYTASSNNVAGTLRRYKFYGVIH